MRKNSKNSILFVGILALSFGFVGCNSDELESSQSGDSQTQAIGTPIDFSADVDSDLKKIVYGNPFGGGTSTPILWQHDDKVRIYSPTGGVGDGEQSGVYVATTAVDASSTNFSYDGENTYLGGSVKIMQSDISPQSFYATYPEGSTFADGKVTFAIPANQTLREGTADDGMKNVLLYAKAEDADNSDPVSLTFRNIPTVIALNIADNDRVIERIEVRAMGAFIGKPIAGVFTGDVATDPATCDFATAGYTTSGTESDLITVTPRAADGGDFKNGILYIAVAPYALDGLSVAFTDKDGATSTLIRTTSVTPRKLYTIAGKLKWQPANSKNMGILVRSDINPLTGLVMTRVIGKMDGTLAWEVNDNNTVKVRTTETTPTALTVLAGSNPLYFATGNLLIPSADGGVTPSGEPAYIEPIDGTTNTVSTTDYGVGTLNGGYFVYGDPTGVKGYLAADLPLEHISGTQYDIARATIGAEYSDWRLPNAVEWGFLIEEIAINTKSEGIYNIYWPSLGDSDENKNTYESTYAPYQTTTDYRGYLIESSNGASIFLPALGANVSGRGGHGFYWSGSEYESDPGTGRARVFNIAPTWWNIFYNSIDSPFSIRPVSE